MDAHKHVVTVSLSPLPIWLDADATRLEQLIVNLLTNAAKYTPDRGHIALTVRQETDRKRSEAAGFNHHLVKPADFVALQDVLATVSQAVT